MTHDRVMRFVPEFDSPGEAARFATTQALAWIDAPARAADRGSSCDPLSPDARRLLQRTGTSWGLSTTASLKD